MSTPPQTPQEKLNTLMEKNSHLIQGNSLYSLTVLRKALPTVESCSRISLIMSSAIGIYTNPSRSPNSQGPREVTKIRGKELISNIKKKKIPEVYMHIIHSQHQYP